MFREKNSRLFSLSVLFYPAIILGIHFTQQQQQSPFYFTAFRTQQLTHAQMLNNILSAIIAAISHHLSK
jgi:hypothetical protein